MRGYAQVSAGYAQDTHGSSQSPIASRVTRPRKLPRARSSIVPSTKQCPVCFVEFQSAMRLRIYCDDCREKRKIERAKQRRKRNYERHRESKIARQRERIAELKASGKFTDVQRRYRKAQRARYVAAGLTTNGTLRKLPIRDVADRNIKLQRVAYRKWHQEWLRSIAPSECVAAWYVGTGKPWNNVRFTTSEKFRVRYNADDQFRAREILKAQHRKRSRSARIEAQSDGSITPKALGSLFAEAKFCAYCLTRFESTKDKTADHVEPLFLGGKHSIDNIVISCLSCNSSKGKKGLLEWLTVVRLT